MFSLFIKTIRFFHQSIQIYNVSFKKIQLSRAKKDTMCEHVKINHSTDNIFLVIYGL